LKNSRRGKGREGSAGKKEEPKKSADVKVRREGRKKSRRVEPMQKKEE